MYGGSTPPGDTMKKPRSSGGVFALMGSGEGHDLTSTTSHLYNESVSSLSFCERVFIFFMDTIHYLSPEGLKKMQEELQDLKFVKRREVADRIETAKALGDLSENAEYHEAMESLGTLETKIFELEEILKNHHVIQPGGADDNVVHVGSKIRVRALGKEKILTIVGSNEAQPAIGLISNESPIGSSLLGARVGERIEVKTPAGMVNYEILEIVK